MDIRAERLVGKKVRPLLNSGFEKLHPAMVVGAALFYAWNLYSIYCGSVVSSVSYNATPYIATVVTSISATLGFVAIACVFHKTRHFYSLGLAASVAAGLATPAGLFAIHALGADPALVRLAVEVVCRLGSCWVIVSWGAQFAWLDAFSITVNILSTFAVALITCLVVMFCPYVVRVIFISAALPASMLLLVHARTVRATDTRLETHMCSDTFLGLTWRIILVFFLFGVVTWIAIVSNQTGENDSLLSSVVVIVGNMAVVLPLLIMSLRQHGALTKSYTYKVVLPLIMSGVLLMGVASANTALCWPLISIGYTCFDLFCFALYADACRRTGTDALRAFGWCRAFESAAPLAALFVMAVFERVSDGSETIFMDLIVPTAVFAILAMIALDKDDLFERGRLNVNVSYPQAEVLYFARQCQATIDRYALSPREAEILSLIVRGRSVPHISQRLGISPSTTRTHITHIYEKLGVCDRQEMIDLIESVQPTTTSC